MAEKTHFRNSDKECRHCRFFDEVTNLEQRTQIKICRFNPPHVATQAMPQQDPKTGQVIGIAWNQATVWPIVNYSDWCSNFARAPEKTQ